MHKMLEEPKPKKTGFSNKSTYSCKDRSNRPSTSNHSECCCVNSRSKKTKDCCCGCPRRRHASPLTCIGVCILIIVYTFLGAFLFLAIEGSLTFQKEETAVAASKPNLSNSDSPSGFEIRSRTVEKLWSITEDLNILYKENWTRLAAKELVEFQRVLVKSMRGGSLYENQASYYDGMGSKHKWTFATSFLYALTLITTIGYGNVTPKTSIGKIAAIAYACVGIPIVMVYLSTIGEALAQSFRTLYSKTCRSRHKKDLHSSSDCLDMTSQRICEKSCKDCYAKTSKNPTDSVQRFTPFQAALNLDSFSRHYHWTCPDRTRVPIILCLFLIALYLALGMVIFHHTEKWSFLDSCYFTFSSLGTIGFGDLYPGYYGSTISHQAEDIAICVCCIYILVGVLVVAMCFNLIQDEIAVNLKSCMEFCGSGKSRAVHDTEKECGEEISMSIVS